MPRPHKLRNVDRELEICFFKPTGIPIRELEIIQLGEDELEAVRLADLEGLYQVESAERMGVSRPTFGNVINSAHKKIAEALTMGKAIQIGGGPVNHGSISDKTQRCCRRHGQKRNGSLRDETT